MQGNPFARQAAGTPPSSQQPMSPMHQQVPTISPPPSYADPRSPYSSSASVGSPYTGGAVSPYASSGGAPPQGYTPITPSSQQFSQQFAQPPPRFPGPPPQQFPAPPVQQFPPPPQQFTQPPPQQFPGPPPQFTQPPPQQFTQPPPQQFTSPTNSFGPMGGMPAPPSYATQPSEPPTQQFQNLGFDDSRSTLPKIEPSQMPSPVGREGDVTLFKTDISRVPPSPASRFHVMDEGNCSPRFMRMTTYNVPCTHELLADSALPLAAILQPLATSDPSEDKISLVDFGPEGPLRCRRCRAYINPFVLFVDGGRKYTCSLCSFMNEVPLDYFSPLEASGRRADLLQRPELSKGTVEFVASSEYIWRTPMPMPVLFVIDVSTSSVASGLLKSFVHSILDMLDTMPGNTKVGFITYDNTVHFYNFGVRYQQPQMMIVSDINSVFVPLGEGVLVDYRESKHLIENLLERLPLMFTATTGSPTSCAGSALEAASLALETTGGKVIFMQSSLPTVGVGLLKPRDESGILDTDKESTLFKPQSQFYQELGVKCADKHIGVHLFLCSDSSVDIATIGEISKATGGQVYHYPNILSETERQRFVADLEHNLFRFQGYEAVMRTRCSTGLSVKGYHGHFHLPNKTDIALANIDCDKTIAVTLQHDSSIPDHSAVVLQTALLYTTSTGERRIRIHTMSLHSTSTLANLYKGADLHSIINIFGRHAILEASRGTLQQARNTLVSDTTAPLFTYRKYCASATSGASQLILPESLKLLPIFTLSLLKSVLFTSNAGIRPDNRIARFMAFNSMGPALTSLLIYPHLYSLHNLSPEVGTEDEAGSIRLPPTLRLSISALESGGIYLMDDGHDLFLWVSRNAPSSLLSELFGVPSADHVDPLSFTLRELGNETSTRVCKVVEAVRIQSGNRQPIHFLRQGGPFEGRFFMRLIEDKVNNQPSYTDFLCSLHRHIQNKLSGEAASQKAMKAMAEWG